jgi:hypothetical protein
MTRCLGRRPARLDTRTLRFATYAKALPPAPDLCDWAKHTPAWPMMLNDRLGDCTIASAGHLIQEWTANAYGGTGAVVPDAEILETYQAVTGYNPSDPNSDRGAYEIDVLNYWRTKGVGGHKIWAYASVSPKNHEHVKQATYLFGGLYIGLALPIAAQAQLDAGQAWDVTVARLRGKWQPGSWGGHAVPIVAYDASWITVVTWGRLQKMSWSFHDAYCEEAYAVLGGSDWMKGKNPVAPNGFDLATLQADLKAVAA